MQPIRSDADHGERRVGGLGAARVVTVAEEEEKPRPHREELPHVAEVAERREPHAAVAEDLARLARVEDGARKRVRPLGDVPPRDQPAREREDGRRDDDEVPVEPADPVHEVRERRADRDRARERAERKRAAAPEPRRHQLERGRVDAGEEEAGREAERNRALRAVAATRSRFAAAAPTEPMRITTWGGKMSATLPTLERRAPATKPSCTAIVSQALVPRGGPSRRAAAA